MQPARASQQKNAEWKKGSPKGRLSQSLEKEKAPRRKSKNESVGAGARTGTLSSDLEAVSSARPDEKSRTRKPTTAEGKRPSLSPPTAKPMAAVKEDARHEMSPTLRRVQEKMAG